MAINKQQLTDRIIVPALKDYGLYSDAAVELLLGTAAVESQLGTYVAQIGGPALGLYQMEPATHDDIWDHFLEYRSGLRLAIEYEFGKAPLADRLVHDLRYATLMARIHYLRVKESLPASGDIDEQARYWKTYYNTVNGAGSIAAFRKAYIDLIIGGA